MEPWNGTAEADEVDVFWPFLLKRTTNKSIAHKRI